MESRFYIDQDIGCVFSFHGGSYQTGQYREYIEHVLNLPQYRAGLYYFAVIHPIDSGAIRDEDWIEILEGGKFVCADGLNNMFGLGMMRRETVTAITPLKDRGAALEFLGIKADFVPPHYYDLTHISS